MAHRSGPRRASRPRTWDEADLVRVVATLTDTFLENRRRDRLPQVLAEVAVDLLPVRGAAVTLVGPDGELTSTAHPSRDVRDLEELQLRHPDGGPTTEVIAGADPTLLHAAGERFDRYAVLAEAAVEVGVSLVYAVPIRRRGATFGSLTMYGDPASDLGPNEREIARAVADIAAIGILQRRLVASADLQVSQLEQALASRVVIEQAKGVLVGQGRYDLDEAFLAIRRCARNRHRRIEDVAREIVAGTEKATAELRAHQADDTVDIPVLPRQRTTTQQPYSHAGPTANPPRGAGG